MNKREFFKKIFKGAAVAIIAPKVIEDCVTDLQPNDVHFTTKKYVEGVTRFNEKMLSEIPFPKVTFKDLMPTPHLKGSDLYIYYKRQQK